MFNREKFLAENVVDPSSFNLDTFVNTTNKAFSKANKARKRVLIAKDVILRVALNNVNIKTGNFLSKSDFLHALNRQLSFKDVLNNNNETCKVCAKGALFCSIIGRINNVTINDIQGDRNSLIDNNHKQLLKYFSAEQLDMIETAFESGSYLNIISADAKDKCVEFYKQYTYPTDRLIAICENIINNKGTFVL